MDVVKSEAFAESTRKTRSAQWKRYETFCNNFRMDPAPITPQKVCRFLVHLGESLKFSTINNYVSALNAMAKLSANYQDLKQDYGVTLVLRGLKRRLGDIRAPMDPLLPADLSLIFQVVDLSDVFQLSVWLAVCIAFRTLLHKSHFFVAQEDVAHLLHLSDITFKEWGIGSQAQKLFSSHIGISTYQCLLVGHFVCSNLASHISEQIT